MLTRNEVIELLKAIASTDRRKVGEPDIVMWQATLAAGHVTSLQDALRAVATYYAENREWIMPADVVKGVRKIRHARLDHAPSMTELMDDVDPEDPNWQPIYAARRRAIADGRPPLKAVGS
jgi:hypothetical protein